MILAHAINAQTITVWNSANHADLVTWNTPENWSDGAPDQNKIAQLILTGPNLHSFLHSEATSIGQLQIQSSSDVLFQAAPTTNIVSFYGAGSTNTALHIQSGNAVNPYKVLLDHDIQLIPTTQATSPTLFDRGQVWSIQDNLAQLQLLGTLNLGSNLTLAGSNRTIEFGSSSHFGDKTLQVSGTSRSITLNQGTALDVYHNISLSDHSTNGYTLHWHLQPQSKLRVFGDILNGSSNGSGMTFNGNGNVELHGDLLNQGNISINQNAHVQIYGTATTGSLIIQEGSAHFYYNAEQPRVSIGGLTLGGNAAHNVSLSFDAGTSLYLRGDLFLHASASAVELKLDELYIDAQRTFTIANNQVLTLDTSLRSLSANPNRVHKAGLGTLILKGENLTSGSNNALTAGTLILDFSNDTRRKLSNEDLAIYTGTLQLIGNTEEATRQQIKNLNLIQNNATFASGETIIQLTGNAQQSLIFEFNQITRSSGSGSTVLFDLDTHTAVHTQMTNRNLLAAWSTLYIDNQYYFAAIEQQKLTAAGVQHDSISRFWQNSVSNLNHTDDLYYSGTSDLMYADTIRFANSAGLTIDRQLLLKSGGLLIDASSTASGLLSGTLLIGNGELFVNHYGGEAFNIQSQIRHQNHYLSPTNLTLSGSGELILSAHNLLNSIAQGYTSGATATINGGTLTLDQIYALGRHTRVRSDTQNQAQLKLQGDAEIGTLSSQNLQFSVDIGNHHLKIFQTSGLETFTGQLIGSGIITRTTLNPVETISNLYLTNSNLDFNGHFVIDRGSVLLTGANIHNLGAVNTISIHQHGALVLDNNGLFSDNNNDYHLSNRINNQATILLKSANGRLATDNIIRGLSIRLNNDSTGNHGEVFKNLVFENGSNYILIEATKEAALIRATDSILRNNFSTLNLRGNGLANASGTRTRLQMSNGSTAAGAAFANQFRAGGAYANGTSPLATAGADASASNNTTLSIVPWAIGENLSTTLPINNPAQGNGNTLLTFLNTFIGFRPLNLNSEYATFNASSTGNGHNVRESLTSNRSLSAAAVHQVNSLVLNNQNNSTQSVTLEGNGTLRNTSGTFLFTGVAASNASGTALHNLTQGGIVVQGFDKIEVNGNHAEYIMFVTTLADAGVEIRSNLTSQANFTKSGLGLLKLLGQNTDLQTITINEGTLEIQQLSNIGSQGDLVFAGGSLRLADDWKTGDQLSTRNIRVLDGTSGEIHTNATDRSDTSNNITVKTFGDGSGTFYKSGHGTLTIIGDQNSQHTGTFVVNHSGAVAGIQNGQTDQLRLHNTHGYAIGGDLIIGSYQVSQESVTGGATVRLMAHEQIANHAVIYFNSKEANGGSRAYFYLNGFNESVAGIINNDNQGVIQNGANSHSTLSLIGDGHYYFGGYMRSTNSDTPGVLNVSKTGAGIQILSGNNITYNGNTSVLDGELVLLDTSDFASHIQNQARVKLESVYNNQWSYRQVISGSGDLIKAGSGQITLTNTHSYQGLTFIEKGRLALGANSSISQSKGIYVYADAVFDVSAKGSTGYQLQQTLYGNGKVQGNLQLHTGSSLSPGSSTSSQNAMHLGNQLGQLQLDGSLTLMGGSLQLQIFEASLHHSDLTSLFESNYSSYTQYIDSQVSAWNSLSNLDIESGVAKHDLIQLTGDMIWNTGSTIQVSLFENGEIQAGDVFRLLDFANMTGTMDLGTNADHLWLRSGGELGDLILPDAAGLYYDLRLLQSDGIITVVTPEPNRALLLLFAALVTVNMRRRN